MQHDAINRMLTNYGAMGFDEAGGAPSLQRSAQTDKVQSMSELIDAKIAASEARTDTKFAQLDARFVKIDARFDQMFTRMDGISEDIREMRSDNRNTRSTVRNSAFALAGLIVGIVALAAAGLALLPNAYSFGLSTRDMIQTEVQKAVSQQPPKQ